ncbi:hypothetical protein GCM10010378_08980 [Streptomyces viridochromogenes]
MTVCRGRRGPVITGSRAVRRSWQGGFSAALRARGRGTPLVELEFPVGNGMRRGCQVEREDVSVPLRARRVRGDVMTGAAS